jgi:hypothetical protein
MVTMQNFRIIPDRSNIQHFYLSNKFLTKIKSNDNNSNSLQKYKSMQMESHHYEFCSALLVEVVSLFPDINVSKYSSVLMVCLYIINLFTTYYNSHTISQLTNF